MGTWSINIKMLSMGNLQHELNIIQRKFPTIYGRIPDSNGTCKVKTLKMLNRIMEK